jgi:hypothetical protein
LQALSKPEAVTSLAPSLSWEIFPAHVRDISLDRAGRACLSDDYAGEKTVLARRYSGE